jgi:hypothetical protein
MTVTGREAWELQQLLEEKEARLEIADGNRRRTAGSAGEAL